MNRTYWVLAFLLSGLCSCDSQETIEVLGKYDTPFIPGSTWKYTYVRTPGPDTISHIYYFAAGDKKSYRSETYFNGDLSFESNTLIEGDRKKLVDEYYYQYPDYYYDMDFGDNVPLKEMAKKDVDKLKGDIEIFREIEDGSMYRGLETKISYVDSDKFKTVFLEEMVYGGDTSVVWQKEPACHSVFFFSCKEKDDLLSSLYSTQGV